VICDLRFDFDDLELVFMYETRLKEEDKLLCEVDLIENKRQLNG